MMDLARFETLCDAYGGEIAHWPQAERDAALKLAAHDPAAAACLAEARALDGVLAQSSPQAPSAALRDRILDSAPRERARPSFDWLLKACLGAGLAAAGVAGVLVGSSLTPAADLDDTPAIAALEASPEATAFGPVDESLEG